MFGAPESEALVDKKLFANQIPDRLLIVPHVYAEDIKVRTIELGKRLTGRYQVYCLRWRDAVHQEGAHWLTWRWRRVKAVLHSLCKRIRVSHGSDGIKYIDAPLMQPMLLGRVVGLRNAWEISRTFNTMILGYLVRRFAIKNLLIANWSFRFPSDCESTEMYFDVVDYFDVEDIPQALLIAHTAYLKNVLSTAKRSFIVSLPLLEKLRLNFSQTGVYIPNGVDLQEVRGVDDVVVAKIRSRHGLEGKFVIGYIGNHGPYAGIDFVLDVFQRVRCVVRNAVLLVVGPVDHWGPTVKQLAYDEDIVFTGRVPWSEIGAYMNALDVGLFAWSPGEFADYSFQIKVVEYTACRKTVIAIPTPTLQQLNWPNVLLVERNLNDWVAAILQAKNRVWDSDWDEIIEEYDWQQLANRMANWMDDCGDAEGS